MKTPARQTILKASLCAMFALVAFFPLISQAASVTWTQYEPMTWWYRWTQNDGGLGYAEGLINPTVQILYHATITDTDNGQILPPGSSVPVGTHLSLEFVPHQDQDIYWFGTGKSNDSPYGEWEPNASGPAVACNQQDFTGVATVVSFGFFGSATANIYIPFAVAPPSESLSGMSGLSCGALSSAPDGGVAAACIATQPGQVAPDFNFANTYGIFYYRYSGYDGGGCVGDNTGMTTDPASSGGQLEGLGTFINQAYEGGNPVPPTQLPVPSQFISYPLTITGAASSPNAPQVTPNDSSCSVDGVPSYDITGTDSDSSAQVRYGISWDDSGTVEDWVPANGDVPQGTEEVVEQAGNSSTFEVLTEDSNGNDSSWTTVSAASCPAAPPTGICPGQFVENSGCVSSCDPGFTPNGNICDQDNCATGYGDDPQTGMCTFDGCPSDYNKQLDANGNPECVQDACQPGTLVCQGGNLYTEDGMCHQTLDQSCPLGCNATGNGCIQSPTADIVAHPSLVESGGMTSISWKALGVSSCTIEGSNDQNWSCSGQSCAATTTETSDSITAQTTYVLECTGLDDSSIVRSASVNVAPSFCETGAPNCP